MKVITKHGECVSCKQRVVYYLLELCLGECLGHSLIVLEACTKCGRLVFSATPRPEKEITQRLDR